jgi:hypothetical protein
MLRKSTRSMFIVPPKGYHFKTQQYINAVNGNLSLLYIYDSNGDQVTVSSGFDLDDIVRRIEEVGSSEVVSLTSVGIFESGIKFEEGIKWEP